MELCFTQMKVRTLFPFIVKHHYLVRYIVSGGEGEGDDDNVPLAPQKVSCKSAKWKTIAGLAFTDSETKIIVVDTKLPSVRLISGIKQLW